MSYPMYWIWPARSTTQAWRVFFAQEGACNLRTCGPHDLFDATLNAVLLVAECSRQPAARGVISS